MTVDGLDQVDPSRHLILDLNYTGDVARVYAGERFLTDNFFNGLPIHLDLKRYAADVRAGGLSVLILPLQKDAGIAIDPRVLPDFGGKASVESLDGVVVLERREATLVGGNGAAASK